MNPWKALFGSRKFWLVIMDLFVSFALYFVAKYAQVALEDVKFVILGIQPVFLLIIYTLYGENVQELKKIAEIESSKSYYLSETTIREINDFLKSINAEDK